MKQLSSELDLVQLLLKEMSQILIIYLVLQIKMWDESSNILQHESGVLKQTNHSVRNKTPNE